MEKIKFIFCILFFQFVFYTFAQESDSQFVHARLINIISADSIEYISGKQNDSDRTNDKDTEDNTEITETNSDISEEDSTNDELIILLGNVSVSIEEGATINTVTADKIVYNKTQNTLHADGKVQYQRIISGKLTNSFLGDSILFDIDQMSGVFLDGIVETNSQKINGTQYVIHSELTGYDGSGVIAFKNAKLTSSSSEEPLWSLNASRLWLLPGNEMSFANGYFSIGIIPIFYLPFFYYPSDEMIFHPVFGYKPRGGYFTLTTTYVLGRKTSIPQDDNSTFANFLVSDSVKEQKRNGLFLQNLNEDLSTNNQHEIKIIADAYSSLGYLVGLDGNLPSLFPYFNTFNFNAYLGFSHTLYPVTSSYSTYTKYNTSGKTQFNDSNFFGLTLPFRYSFNFNTTFSKQPFNFQISLPFISDPFFQSDFLSRSEDMNWFSFMRSQNSSSNIQEQTSYNWNARFSVNPYFKVLAPYIQNISLQNLSTTILFYSKENRLLTGEEKMYSPARKFYFPQAIRPEFSFGFSGTLFSTSNTSGKKKYIRIDGLKNPFLLEDKIKDATSTSIENNTVENSNADNDKSKTAQDTLLDVFFPLYRFDSKNQFTTAETISYNLKYAFKLGFLSENIYDYTNWNESKNINWADFASHHYKINYDIQLNSSLSVLSQLLNMDNSVRFTQNHQRTPYIKNTAQQESIQTNNYRLSIFQLTNTNSISLNPLYFSPIFRGTTLQWSIRETLVRNSFTGTYNAPNWEVQIAKWNKEFITQHNFTSTFSVNINNYAQTLKLVSALPPVLSSFSMSGNFQHPYGTISFDTRVYEKETPGKRWYWTPFTISANWTLPFNISTTQTYSFNIEEKMSELFRFKFNWKYISLSLVMQRDAVYKLDPAIGWQVETGTQKFQLKNADISFSNISAPFNFYFWKNRINLSFYFTTNLSINLQRATESYFTFSPTIQFSIHEFLNLKISAVTRNDVIARYFQKSLNLGVTIPGETNIFKDLLQSFYFWDTAARRASGFKLKSLDIELQHDLKDWSLSFIYSFAPQLKYNATLARNEYSFIPKITFMVNWKPINDIKVRTVTEGDNFTVERGTIY